ncbi:MAG: hypothetical protein C3F10_07000 [Dehalococcoidia bacterium]|nr:MAG: hypothetical protein C3F10_07000 [Dehalococcoidia bacterium]
MSSSVCTSPRTTGDIRMPVFTSSMATLRPITAPAEDWRIVPRSKLATPTALLLMSTSSACTRRIALRSRLSRVVTSPYSSLESCAPVPLSFAMRCTPAST